METINEQLVKLIGTTVVVNLSIDGKGDEITIVCGILSQKDKTFTVKPDKVKTEFSLSFGIEDINGILKGIETPFSHSRILLN